jgi:predicted dehydrogenase
MTTTRWGILSTARINRLVLAGARRSDRVHVLAVASRDAERAEAYAGEHGIERSYGSYEALLEDPDVEAVYISLPNSLHVEWSIKALEAGKHVLCEKPLTRRPAEAEAAFDTAERAGRLLMEAFMYRHHPQTKRWRQLVDDGAIGELRLVRAAFSFPLTELGNVRMRPELDGGALMDVGCYCVSASRLLAGEPERVTAEQVLAPSGVDVRFTATMRFAQDVVCHFDAAFDLPSRSALEVVGSEGSLHVRDPWHCRETGIELRRAAEVERIDVPEADRYQLQLENLGDAIHGVGEPLLGRADAVGQARALEALYSAAERPAGSIRGRADGVSL